MRRSEPQSFSNAAYANRLHHLAAAFAAFRRANKPGRRIPSGLRAQVVAALNAGVSATAIEKACRLSWSQVTRWRSAALADGTLSVRPQADVLSVVDDAARSPSSDTDVELRVGPWRISLSRVAD